MLLPVEELQPDHFSDDAMGLGLGLRLRSSWRKCSNNTMHATCEAQRLDFGAAVLS